MTVEAIYILKFMSVDIYRASKGVDWIIEKHNDCHLCRQTILFAWDVFTGLTFNMNIIDWELEHHHKLFLICLRFRRRLKGLCIKSSCRNQVFLEIGRLASYMHEFYYNQ